MFLRYLRKKLGSTYYVQIWEQRLKVTCVETKEVFDEPPLIALETKSNGIKTVIAIGNKVNKLTDQQYETLHPFSHPRTLLADFVPAEKILQHAFFTIHKNKFIKPAPTVVMHPMEKLEGGLTQIEHRAFRELAAGAGASEVYIHTGDVIPLTSFDVSKL